MIFQSLQKMKSTSAELSQDPSFASQPPSMELACDFNADCQKVLRSHIDPWLQMYSICETVTGMHECTVRVTVVSLTSYVACQLKFMSWLKRMKFPFNCFISKLSFSLYHVIYYIILLLLLLIIQFDWIGFDYILAGSRSPTHSHPDATGNRSDLLMICQQCDCEMAFSARDHLLRSNWRIVIV